MSTISRSVILGTVFMSVWSVHGVTMWLAAFNPARKQDLEVLKAKIELI